MITGGGLWTWYCQGVILVADSNLVQLIKRIAVEAVQASKPCDYTIGTVTSASPLKIKISQTLELEEDFLHLARSVTDYETEITVKDWNTEIASNHTHPIKGKKKIVIHSALKKGEKVLMIRKAGGQDYIVIDRVVS